MQWQMTCSGERQSDLSPWCRQQEDSKKTIGEFDCVIRSGVYNVISKLMEHSLNQQLVDNLTWWEPGDSGKEWIPINK